MNNLPPFSMLDDKGVSDTENSHCLFVVATGIPDTTIRPIPPERRKQLEAQGWVLPQPPKPPQTPPEPPTQS